MLENKKSSLQRLIYALGSFSVLKFFIAYWLIGVVLALILSLTAERSNLAMAVSTVNAAVTQLHDKGCLHPNTPQCEQSKEGAISKVKLPIVSETLSKVEDLLFEHSVFSKPMTHDTERFTLNKDLSGVSMALYAQYKGVEERNPKELAEVVNTLRGSEGEAKTAFVVLTNTLSVFYSLWLFKVWLFFFVVNLLANTEYLKRRRAFHNEMRIHRKKMFDRYSL